jgi:hypothetical protein
MACALFLAAAVPPLGCPPAGADGITVMLDGKVLSFDTDPQIIGGRTMVPMRGIFEPLGFTVTWRADTREIIGIRGSLTITLQIDNPTALVGTEKVSLDVPPQIYRGRTLVPLRFVADAAGTYVSWDGDRRVVRIETAPATPPSGTPIAQGDYDPSKQLVLDGKVNSGTLMEIVLEPGALTAPAHVSLYALSVTSYRLILGADPIASNLPGVAGFDGARIKAKYTTQTNATFMRRPVMLANGEMIDNKIYYGTDSNGNQTITTCVKVVERDTSLAVNEATDYQWQQMQIAY